MALRSIAGKVQIRTPEQMAKHAMKQVALGELASSKLPAEAQVIVKYNGTTHVLTAAPTVNIAKGEILFHFGASGSNRIDCGLKDDAGKPVLFGVGGNIMTSLGLDDAVCEEIRSRYKLTSPGSEQSEEDALEAGESTV